MRTQADLGVLTDLHAVLRDCAAAVGGLDELPALDPERAGDAEVAAALGLVREGWRARRELLGHDLATLAAYVEAARQAFADVDRRVITVELGGGS